MRRVFPLLALAFVTVAGPRDLDALESSASVHPGLNSLRLVTDRSAIRPGETFTVGLHLDPLPEHHTYWRGPGIVGVATRLEWSLPAGFTVGEMIWPAPQTVVMAGILANGYRTPTLLLTELTAPADLPTGSWSISAKCSWMSCATSCNPGIADLALTIATLNEGETPEIDKTVAEDFEAVRQHAPKPAPSNWTFSARLPKPDRIELELVVPGLDPTSASSIHFFCDDMQIDSDEPQQVTMIDSEKGIVRLSLSRPEFAPKSPTALTGVLQCPGGWPEIRSEFVECSATWPDGTFPQ